MITGTITTMSGQPAVGFKVKAFDRDDATGGKDDPMGEATTDAQGRYSIGPYAGKAWDTKLPGGTSWRPDIYIRVYQMIGGRWVVVKQSGTLEDHRLADDVTINLRLTGISGIITDWNGAPVAGALVRAYDHDDLVVGLNEAHDFMGESRTNASGRFEMLYEHKDWDTKVPGSTSWRPDIFVEVLGTVRDHMIKIGQSQTYSNHPLHENLDKIRVNVPPRAAIDFKARDPGSGGLNVLAYNIYMRPSKTFNDGQSLRVPRIAEEIKRDYYDVIVFNEAFDDHLRAELRKNLASVYAYNAKVPETGNPLRQDGSVKILSRWPIMNGNGKGQQRVFGLPCLGADCLADKGVVYVKIVKAGVPYHIFGTHLQADENPAMYGGKLVTSRDVRRSQLNAIRKFINEMSIPKTEAVIITGDLNINRYANPPDEYNEMLKILNAAHPKIEGYPYSFDGRLNYLARSDGKQYLWDYVLYLGDHKQPMQHPGVGMAASNRVMFYRTDKPWRKMIPQLSWFIWDISDHFPVFGQFQFAPSMKAAPATPSPPSSTPPAQVGPAPKR